MLDLGKRGVYHRWHMPKAGLSKIIRSAREAKGWSRATLSVRAGVGSSTIARIELQNEVPRIGTLKALTKALGLRMSEVFEDAA